MERHGVERVFIRNQFYFENYRSLVCVVALLLGLIVSLAGFALYQHIIWPKPKYFATTPDGRPIPVVSLDKPLYSDSTAVVQWAVSAIHAIYALDFMTWRTALQDAEVYFTPKGYQDFLAALKASTNLEAVKNRRQVVSIEITSTPIVKREGRLSSDLPYSWSIQMPAIVTYQNSDQEIIKQKGTILTLIERASLLRHKEGIAIQQLVFQAE